MFSLRKFNHFRRNHPTQVHSEPHGAAFAVIRAATNMNIPIGFVKFVSINGAVYKSENKKF